MPRRWSGTRVQPHLVGETFCVQTPALAETLDLQLAQHGVQVESLGGRQLEMVPWYRLVERGGFEIETSPHRRVGDVEVARPASTAVR